MITVLYASRATQPMDGDALDRLLKLARSRNAAEDVTGMLVYAYGSFLQQIEGEVDAIDRLFTSIEADHRHEDLRLLMRRPISERRYPGWAMGFEPPDAEMLSGRIPGYVPTVSYPLVDTGLITNGEMAENLLALFATGTQSMLSESS